ncbi:peptidoglycan-binding domain-containing protein, partial [Faecalibacterium sp. DFI.5.82]|uniref:peptidoglycan-binding domain-containing protein n=1 Tax=Faecalibacterium sp. DFI.5.82 TaxID=3031725 RepID=UPI0023AF2C32
MQARLSALGFDAGDPDGLFGAKTTAAVKQFQLSRSLTVDGKVGAKTKAALFAPLPQKGHRNSHLGDARRPFSLRNSAGHREA